jgi:hypothetical protein
MKIRLFFDHEWILIFEPPIDTNEHEYASPPRPTIVEGFCCELRNPNAETATASGGSAVRMVLCAGFFAKTKK